MLHGRLTYIRRDGREPGAAPGKVEAKRGVLLGMSLFLRLRSVKCDMVVCVMYLC